MSLTARDKQYFDDNMLTDEDFDFGMFKYTGYELKLIVYFCFLDFKNLFFHLVKNSEH